MTITVIRSGTVITGDGRASLPDTDVVLVDGVVRDLPHSDPDRSFGQADLIVGRKIRKIPSPVLPMSSAAMSAILLPAIGRLRTNSPFSSR